MLLDKKTSKKQFIEPKKEMKITSRNNIDIHNLSSIKSSPSYIIEKPLVKIH
jgi:hypothetical protein